MAQTVSVPPVNGDESTLSPAVLETRRRVSAALGASQMGLWSADLNAGRITWTPDVYDLLGCQAFDGTMAGFSRWIHVDDRDAALEALNDSLRSGEPLNHEFRWWHERGEWRWIVCRGRGERDGDGRVSQMFGTVQDITEAHAAAEELRSSERRFRQVTENIEEVFWLTNVEKTEILYISPAYATVWGRSMESLFADPIQWLEAIHPEDRAEVAAQIDRQEASEYDVEYRIVRPDGSIRWVHDRAFPVRDEAGNVVRIAGVAEDITRRRELEAQLRHTQKMQSIGELAGGVAHDFNNLLTVISTAAQLLEGALGENEQAHELLEEIRSAQQRATSLTRQLLAFSRREVVEPRVVEVDTVVADTEKMLRRLLGEDVLLVTRLEATGKHVRIDPGQLVQVLMNLAVNARDAMPMGGQLHIRTEREIPFRALEVNPDAAPFVKLTFVDTGCGMTEDVRSRAFEPFFTTKSVGQGTGMGLAVVHGIVAQNGGYIELRSEPGSGSVFQVYLPAVEAAAAIEGQQAPEAPVSAETVLVVEDEASVRRMVEKALRRQGYNVMVAASGMAALEMVDGGARPDLLLTDIVMPGMDGRQLSEKVRQSMPAVKILYTSGYTDDALLKRGIRQAEVAFLPKPYSLETLATRVREVLKS